MRLSIRVVGVMVCSLALAAAARGATWNEATQGDISGNRQSPSLLTLTPGTNSILATTGSGDLEYLRLAVPAGGRINELRLTSFSGFDPTAFIAVQPGTTFTEDPNSPNPSNLQGYSHFGPGNVNTNLLSAMGTGPLTGPNYTLWIQQLGSASVYQIDVIATPEPGGALVLAGAAGVVCLRRRARRRGA